MGMLVRSLGMPVGMIAVLVGVGGMLLSGFVIAMLVMMGCLVMVVSDRHDDEQRLANGAPRSHASWTWVFLSLRWESLG